jgi:CII-binding regulator of phage lambda lysogenization HflD
MFQGTSFNTSVKTVFAWPKALILFVFGDDANLRTPLESLIPALTRKK